MTPLGKDYELDDDGQERDEGNYEGGEPEDLEAAPMLSNRASG